MGISVRVLLAISPSADRARPCSVIVFLFVQYPLDTPGSWLPLQLSGYSGYHASRRCLLSASRVPYRGGGDGSEQVIQLLLQCDFIHFSKSPGAHLGSSRAFGLYFVLCSLGHGPSELYLVPTVDPTPHRPVIYHPPHGSGSRAVGLTVYMYGVCTYMQLRTTLHGEFFLQPAFACMT